MAEQALIRRSALDALALARRYGRAGGTPGVTLSVRTRVALASVLARKGQGAALAARVRERLALDLPPERRRAATGDFALVSTGPGQWLAVHETAQGRALERRLREDLAGLASVADQSDGRVVVRVQGPHARDLLAKGVMIDLHPRAFSPGDSAVTVVAYIGVHFWMCDGAPTYDVAVFRSYAADFWHWLMESGAEFGIEVASAS